MVSKVPPELLIGSVVYRVISDPILFALKEGDEECKGAYGFTTAMKATIHLNPDQSPDNQRLTLWHEIMHALAESVMGNPHWDNLGENPVEREEKIIRLLESPTLLVLRNNPLLVKYLMGGS